MVVHDYECPQCGIFERLVHWDEEEVKHECGQKAVRVFVPQRTYRAQAFDPTVVFRDKSGHLRFPGRADVPTPVGYERVELRTHSERRRLQKEVNVREYRRYMESQERQSACLQPELDRARSNLRQKMQRMSPRGRDLAETAMRENNRTSGPDVRFDPGARFEAWED